MLDSKAMLYWFFLLFVFALVGKIFGPPSSSIIFPFFLVILFFYPKKEAVTILINIKVNVNLSNDNIIMLILPI